MSDFEIVHGSQSYNTTTGDNFDKTFPLTEGNTALVFCGEFEQVDLAAGAALLVQLEAIAIASKRKTWKAESLDEEHSSGFRIRVKVIDNLAAVVE